ncbi:MAG: biotin synthase, partial [Solirubrobacteraceae bacterium]|nr:biotin synthase [Solirubrobacteraceae bacterium]
RFEEHGLNVARQPDNGANPRPDNRSGWLEGPTPALATVAESPPPPAGLEIRLWDPSTQLRFRAKGSVPPRPEAGSRPG